MEKICMSLLTVLLICVALSMGKPETVDHGAGTHKAKHFVHGAHNPVFDLEALFGSRNNEDLADLPDDVRAKRLRILAKSHDTNNDDTIEANELKAWILQSFRMLDHEEASEKMTEDDENADGKVTFAELLKKQYDYSEEDVADMEKKLRTGDYTEEEQSEHEDVIRLVHDDRKRFAAADVNKNDELDKDEYVAYFQPYNYPHMFEVEMERTMSDLDKDKNGHISLSEFMGESEDEETRQSEQTNFEELDKDKDGKLSPEEIRPWALPGNDEIADEEVDHLIKECDENGDGKLSVEEIVHKEEEFLGSTATDYGRHLHFVKEEL